MGISVNNLDQAEAWSAGSLLLPGIHTVVIDTAEEGESSNGNPQIELNFRAVAGEQEGGTIRDWLVVVPKTYGKVRSLLEATGFVIESGEFELPTEQLPGRNLSIHVAAEQDRQDPTKTRNRVVGYESVGEGPNLPTGSSGGGRQDDDIPF